MTSLLIAKTRQNFGYIPAWKCVSLGKGVFYLCGHCFERRGDGPRTNSEELWWPGGDRSGLRLFELVPERAICEDCGGKAWPTD